MDSKKKKDKNMALPIEKQRTAAWANIEKMQPESRVALPDLEQVMNAKEWVDSNQK